jgi:signal transduction histidine kinase
MGQEGEREVQGLGLLIIADLTQLMGGEFTVDSVVGEGTTVCITLPADSEGRS